MNANRLVNRAGPRSRDAGRPRGFTLIELLLVIAIIALTSGRGFGQTYDGFGYSVNGTNIAITNYTGSGGAVSIPSSMPGVGTVTSIGSDAFYKCSGITSLTIPGTVTSIGDYAFWGCTGLTGITIPGSVATLGTLAFYECSRLAVVTLGNGVTSIGQEAFEGCSGLTNLTIPASLSNIGEAAFKGCSGLTAFTADPQNPSYSSLGGVLFDKNQRTLVLYPPGRSGDYTIPGTVTAIGDYSFAWCSNFLSDVTIPNSVSSIGDGAFFECNWLGSVTIPSSVFYIGADAFAQCLSIGGAFFQGDAPSSDNIASVFADEQGGGTSADFWVFYPSGGSGWSTPTWNGFNAQQYDYTYTPPVRPVLTLIPSPGAVTPSFNRLRIGTSYQLQVSTDLGAWSNAGPVFQATNDIAPYPQPFNVTNGNHLFFRLIWPP